LGDDIRTEFREFSDSPEELRSSKNRYGNIETVLINDVENGVYNKLIELGGDSNHYYFDYEQ
jgi:hypothetical protein